MKRILQVASCLLLFATLCTAQTFGTLMGQVNDSSGAHVAGANVTVRNVSTNATRSEQTNSDGLYTFPSLLPGTYEMRVESHGFQV